MRWRVFGHPANQSRAHMFPIAANNGGPIHSLADNLHKRRNNIRSCLHFINFLATSGRGNARRAQGGPNGRFRVRPPQRVCTTTLRTSERYSRKSGVKPVKKLSSRVTKLIFNPLTQLQSIFFFLLSTNDWLDSSKFSFYCLNFQCS